MSMIAIAFGVLVVLIIVMKLMRVVMSGCVKLVVVAVMLGGLAFAYWYFKSHLVLPQ